MVGETAPTICMGFDVNRPRVIGENEIARLGIFDMCAELGRRTPNISYLVGRESVVSKPLVSIPPDLS